MEFSRQEYWGEFHCLLQGIFLTQGLNPSLLHCRQTLNRLSHKEGAADQGGLSPHGFAINNFGFSPGFS